MFHRKWRETPSALRCLVSLHFLCGIQISHPIQYKVTKKIAVCWVNMTTNVNQSMTVLTGRQRRRQRRSMGERRDRRRQWRRWRRQRQIKRRRRRRWGQRWASDPRGRGGRRRDSARLLHDRAGQVAEPARPAQRWGDETRGMKAEILVHISRLPKWLVRDESDLAAVIKLDCLNDTSCLCCLFCMLLLAAIPVCFAG